MNLGELLANTITLQPHCHTVCLVPALFIPTSQFVKQRIALQDKNPGCKGSIQEPSSDVLTYRVLKSKFMDWLRKTETKLFYFFFIKVFVVLQLEESCHFKHGGRAAQFIQCGSNHTHVKKETSTVLSPTSPSGMSKRETIFILT